MNTQRKWMPSLGEILDRISICQLKETFDKENKAKWGEEIQDLLHDAQLILGAHPQPQLTADFLRAVIILSQFNTLIWVNEDNQRKGDENGNNLIFTHQANGTRTRAKNIINKKLKNRTDEKIGDCLAATPPDFEPSW
jgi:hypothetical protein